MQISGFPLVTAIEGEARASTEVIAAGVEVQHKNVLALVHKHRRDFERFGKVAFQTRLNRRGSPTEFAMLNEHQAGLLIAFMRNSPRVIEFKVNLIAEFFRMREALTQREQSLWQQMQVLIAREVESKVRASFGSHLMLERKRDIPFFESQREQLENQIQSTLFIN